MDDGSRLPWITAIILLLLAAYFALAETAIASASKIKLRAAADRGDSRAEKALWITDNFDKAITTLLICTNIVHITAASVVTVAVTKKWGLSAVTVSTLLTTVAIFFAGDMLPKSIAKKYSYSLTLSVSGTVALLMKIFSPLSALLASLSTLASKLTRDEAELSVTEDELYDIIEDMTEEGTLDEEQGELISSALQFGDVTVESILTPRVDLTAVDIDDSPEEILSVVKATNHSRIPVYEHSIDNIIGVLQIRKFIKAWLATGGSLDIRAILDKPLFIHQSSNIDEVLPEMTARKQSLAIVTDNYGGTLGIVTIEDILEELVGEIWDEDDIIEEEVIELGNGEYLVDAGESVADVFDRIEYEDPEEDDELVNTLMGEWAYEQFPAIPVPGDSFEYHRLKITVNKMEHNRIIDLKVTLLPEEEPEGGAEE